MNAAELKQGFRDLSRDERLRLLQELWDELAADDQMPELSEVERLELEQRFAEHTAAPETAKSWAQVKAEIQGRH
jgi:putative addiction module component (TIGR02574 family)